jgi:DNA-binding MarR family transcriptional regulator
MLSDTKRRNAARETDELVFLIEEVPRKLRKRFDASTAKFGLTRTQWRALAYVFRTPGLTQTELAKCLELERASVGHVIDQLENAHYLQRRAVVGNRRVWTIHLLPKAKEILPELRKEADAIYARLFDKVSAADIKSMKALLQFMSDNLDR